jgi:two-component system, sensor histidine kinase LadS
MGRAGAVRTCGWMAVLLLSATAVVHAQETAVVGVSRDAVELDGFLEQLAEKAGPWSIEQVISGPPDGSFKAASGKVVNHGFDPAPYWYRVRLHNQEAGPAGNGLWLLEFAYPLLDQIDLYVLRSNGLVDRYATGDRRLPDARQIEHRNLVLPLELAAGESATLYLRVQTESTHLLNLRLWAPAEFAVKTSSENLWFGVYFGLMLGLALYNFFILLAVRDVAYVYHVLYILSMAALQLDLHGFSRQYLWAGPDWPNFSVPVVVASGLLFSILFSRTLLQTRQHSRPLHWLLNAGLLLQIPCFGLAFLAPYSVSMPFNTLAAAAVALILVVAGTGMLLKGLRAARLYLLGWSIYLAAVVLRALEGYGVLPPSLLTDHGIQVGSAAVVTLLSLALADRINSERSEREKLARERAVAEAATAAKGEFLATMSHEIRTPMNAVIGLTQLALKEELPERGRDYLNRIERASRTLLGIINDILDFSKIEAGRLVLEDVPFRLDQVVEDLRSVVGVRAAEKGLRFSCQIAPETPLSLTGDALRLSQILLNLSSNAVKFTEQGSVSVSLMSVRQDGGQVRLRGEVSDTGIGMSKDQMEKLFQDFSQADAGISRRFGGTGLGLAISRRLVEAMGGRIEVRSEPARGSNFGFEVDVRLAPAPVVVTTRAEAAVRLDGRRILVVDDIPTNQLIVREMLQSAGARIDTAANGAEAVDAARAIPYDLVLMDVQMPVMDGLEATRRIRQRDADLPVLAMTANVLQQDREACEAAGMNGFVSKPVDEQQLLATVATNLRRPPSMAAAPAASTASSALPEQLPGIDLAEGLRRMGGRESMLLTMLHSLVEGERAGIERLRTSGSAVDAARTGHALKGLSANLGCPRLMAAAAAVENHARTGDATGLADAVTELEAAFAEVCASVARLPAAQ